jgi:hypothetical protein
MKGMIRLALGAGCLLMLQGCAATYETRFSKAGLSTAAQERDSQRCWKDAQKANLPDDVVAARAFGAFIGGGIIAAVTSAAVSESEKADPKNAYRRKAHQDCMVKRGYKATRVKIEDSDEKGKKDD